MRQQGIFGRYKKGIWRERQRNSQSGRTKDDRAGRKNNGGICVRIQKSSKRK